MSQKQPPVTLQGTMQVHALYTEVIVELYRTSAISPSKCSKLLC